MAGQKLDSSEAKKETTAARPAARRSYMKQSDIPRFTLSEALRLPQALYDAFAGQPVAPHQIAMAVDMSPTSSQWEELCGAAIAYGLTDGGAKAATIALTSLGRRIVAPTEEGQEIAARVEAALRPTIAQRFFGHYNHAKFPPDKIARNVLAEMGVPADRLDKVLEILVRNGEAVGIIHQTKTGPFVAVDTPRPGHDVDLRQDTIEDLAEVDPALGEAIGALNEVEEQNPTKGKALFVEDTTKQRVFITHGKNKEIVSQLKDLLSFGKFIPVVAEDHETTSKPVPDKVLDDMRSCFAGIIHVSSEEELLDSTGNVHHKINENVLIEIGASMALYGRNFILLVQRGIHLPSNLHGLYICYYEGSKLDYEATMKLLRAFNEFR